MCVTRTEKISRWRYNMIAMPSLSTATAILAVFLFLRFCGSALSCSEKICLEDSSCSMEWPDCPFTPTTNCASQAFNATCTGTYTLRALTDCESNCDGCQVCVMIEKVPTGAIVGSCGTDCVNDDCDKSCSVDLVAGQAYFLYVCRTPCPYVNCSHCTSSCHSFGCLCFATLTCDP